MSLHHSPTLYDHDKGLEILPLRDAELRFQPAFYAADEADELMQKLQLETAWKHEKIRLWGQEHFQPRLTAWYADPGIEYTYSGLTMRAQPWLNTIQKIRQDVEAACAQSFNSVLMNLYRNGQDSMGWHSDDEAVLGQNPVIASVSFGATRRFKLRHKTATEQAPLVIDLSNGSLLLMAGSTQHHWQHAITRTARESQPRINLTFRTVLPNEGQHNANGQRQPKDAA